MTLGLLSLGAVEDLLDATFTGFAHSASKELLELLENEVGSSGNVVVQQRSLGYRQARLSYIARSTTEKDTVRGYDETGEEVEFVDFDGSTRSVVVMDYSSDLRFGDVWDVNVTLLEISGPVPLGS